MAYLRLNRSIRPAVSTTLCLPVKKGWQLEQMSTLRMLFVLRVWNTLPQAQDTSQGAYFGWIASFMAHNLSSRDSGVYTVGASGT